MSLLPIDNVTALQLFLTEDIYVVMDELPTVAAPTNIETKPQEIPKAPPDLVTEKVEPIKKDWNFTFVGKNQKKVLILVNDAANQVSNPEGVEVLRKLVKSIGLTGNDFALLNYANYIGATFADLKQFFDCQTLLSFGVDNPALQLPPSDLHTLFTHQQVKIIITQRLDILNETDKKALWTNLKQLI